MNPAFTLFNKLTNKGPLPRVKALVIGVASDFWADGPDNPWASLVQRRAIKGPAVVSSLLRTVRRAPSSQTGAAPFTEAAGDFWHAEPGEVAEKMWGEGWIMPADREISAKLMDPIGLKDRMSVLDLSAGLGQRALNIVERFGIHFTGLETDPEIALRGMARLIKHNKGKVASISSYDPAVLKLTKGYDAIIARELFYRVGAKDNFLHALRVSANKNAFVSFTDYVVDPAQNSLPAIKAWLMSEKHVRPEGLVEMGEMWAKAGFFIISQEDLTALYKKEVVQGIKRLAIFLATNKKPDSATKGLIKQQLGLWTYRIAALDSGMRVFRFLASKQD